MTTYTELVTQIRDYTEVDSTVLTDSIIGSMIRDAELRIFREVDADYTREYATANLNTGSPYLDLPNAPGTSGGSTTRRSIIVRSFLVYDNTSTTNSTTKDFLDKRDSLGHGETWSCGKSRSSLTNLKRPPRIQCFKCYNLRSDLLKKSALTCPT